MGSPEEPPGQQRVLVLYNVPAARPLSGVAADRVSEASVVDVATSVAGALVAGGHAVELLGVTGDLARLERRLEERRVDVIFNLCEGVEGDASQEARVASIIEASGVPFTGSSSAALARAQSKARCRAILAARGIPVAPGVLVGGPGEIPWAGRLPWPVIAKPACEDASLGIESDGVFRDREALAKRVMELAHRYKGGVLIERFLEGREIIAALVGRPSRRGGARRAAPLEVLPLSEVDYSALPARMPHILSYQAKWDEQSPIYRKTPTVCPAPLAGRLAARLSALACAAAGAVGVTGYARVDMRMDARGRAHVLDVNPNPDLSPSAGLARQAAAAGLDYCALVERILACARARRAKVGQVAGGKAPHRPKGAPVRSNEGPAPRRSSGEGPSAPHPAVTIEEYDPQSWFTIPTPS